MCRSTRDVQSVLCFRPGPKSSTCMRIYGCLVCMGWCAKARLRAPGFVTTQGVFSFAPIRSETEFPNLSYCSLYATSVCLSGCDHHLKRAAQHLSRIWTSSFFHIARTCVETQFNFSRESIKGFFQLNLRVRFSYDFTKCECPSTGRNANSFAS